MATGDPDDRIAADIARLYDGVVEKYVEAFWNDLTDSPWLDALAARLVAGGYVLDVGCGPGNFAAYLAGKGFRLHGIDVAPNMIQAATKLVPGHQFEVMDCRRLLLPD